MGIVSKSHVCPYRHTAHENLAFVVYDNGFWCYSCNKGEFQTNDYYAFRDKSYHKTTVKNSLIVPECYSSPKEFSLEILAWLYSYYVFDELIYKYSICYSPYTYYTTSSGQVFEGESLLFPIVSNMEIVAYQQRFFPNKQFFSRDIKHHIFDAGNHNTSTVVLVEDFISAIRVGEIENCIWLQGASLTKELYNYCIKNYTHIKIWLDGDEPGQQAANKIYKQLRKKVESDMIYNAFAVFEPRTIRNIITEGDPKSYSNEEIRRIL